jgi:hypothetical protein
MTDVELLNVWRTMALEAIAAIDEALKVHPNVDGYCQECLRGYPCPTVLALGVTA